LGLGLGLSGGGGWGGSLLVLFFSFFFHYRIGDQVILDRLLLLPLLLCVERRTHLRLLSGLLRIPQFLPCQTTLEELDGLLDELYRLSTVRRSVAGFVVIDCLGQAGRDLGRVEEDVDVVPVQAEDSVVRLERYVQQLRGVPWEFGAEGGVLCDCVLEAGPFTPRMLC